MVDITAISATLASLNLASKFIKDSIEKIKDNAVREKVEELLNAIIPLQTHIISLQVVNSASIQEKEALEKKLREIEDWNKEAASYELKEIASGVYVYAIKPNSSVASPPHNLCAKCFQERKKSILQRVKKSMVGVTYACHSCKSEILDHSKSQTPSYENPGYDPFD